MTTLPTELQSVTIPKGKRMILTHKMIKGKMWIYLLTRMPGDQSRAWCMEPSEYWSLEDKHIAWRDRIVRLHCQPCWYGEKNPPKKPKIIQRSLF